jgi:hypothetical protein
VNYVPFSFLEKWGSIMVRAVVGALASIALFMAMVAVWAQVLGVI